MYLRPTSIAMDN
jgi:branched-chain amino acid aminotransferase